MKSICTDRVAVRLSYDTNFKWHMPILGGICRAEQKLMLFLGPSPSVISGNLSKAQKRIQMKQRNALDFFPQKNAR